jgi:hypothetical protein
MNNNNGTIGNPKFGNTQVQSSKKFIKEEILGCYVMLCILFVKSDLMADRHEITLFQT